MSDDPRNRRTQSERTAGTVDLIVNAALDAIAEVGLRNATTGEISRRAGVSIGALFHHFDTRLDLIVAAVEHQLQERVRRYSEFVARSHAGKVDLSPPSVIGAIRALAREPRSMVWIEVLMEARTDPELRARVMPILTRQRQLLRSVAEGQPALSAMPDVNRFTWIELLRDILNGEAIWEWTIPHHDLDDSKLSALLALAGDLGASPTAA